MSKRFGRNQRRAMRAIIASKDSALDGAFEEIDRQRALTKRAWEQTHRLEQQLSRWAMRIHALVGPGSAFALDPETQAVANDYFEMIAVGGRPHHIRPPRPLSIGDLLENRPMRVDTAEMIVEAFAFFASRHDDRLRMRQIVELRSRDGQQALMMDDRTYHDLKARDPGYLVRYFHERLMAAFLAPKKEPAGRGAKRA